MYFEGQIQGRYFEVITREGTEAERGHHHGATKDGCFCDLYGGCVGGSVNYEHIGVAADGCTFTARCEHVQGESRRRVVTCWADDTVRHHYVSLVRVKRHIERKAWDDILWTIAVARSDTEFQLNAGWYINELGRCAESEVVDEGLISTVHVHINHRRSRIGTVVDHLQAGCALRGHQRKFHECTSRSRCGP